MSGFVFSHSLAARGRPDVRTGLVGKSTEIYAGDVLILTNNATYSPSGENVIRTLDSADDQASISASNGLLGVAMFDMTTDANGKPTAVAAQVTVDSKASVQFALQSLGHTMPTDSDTGLTRIPFYAFSAWNVFSALTEASDIADYYLVHRFASIVASAAAGSAPVHYVDPDQAITASPLIVEGVDVLHPMYNSAGGLGRVFVRCRSTFFSLETGTFWTT